MDESERTIEFLRAFHPDRLWALTAIVPKPGRGIETRTFDPATEVDKARHWIDRFNGQRNIYFNVNAPPEKVSKKTIKADHDRAYYLHVDIDPRAGESLEEEQARLRAIAEQWPHDDIPAPHVAIWSGGGLQLFWRLDEPYVPRERSDEGWADFELYNKGLELRLGGDNCHNVDRIMRLPGTLNIPDERKRKLGRVPALARWMP